MFGPPVSREMTSQDVDYAFERIGTEALVAQYGFYYPVIEGMDRSSRPAKAKTDLGHRDAGRQDDRLHADPADRRLPLPARDAGGGPIPRRSRSASTRPASTAASSSRRART